MADQSESTTSFHRLTSPVTEIFGLSRRLASLMLVFGVLVLAAAIFWFIDSAPPDTLTITGGAPGSSFQANAEKYQAFLAEKGIKLKILSSAGSLENLQRLADPQSKVDVGFVQGGVTNVLDGVKLVSLGSVAYEPLLVFYRSDAPVALLSGFAGKRVSIGSVGSGTRALALDLLSLNGIKTNGSTTLLDLDGNDAAQALLDGNADAVFLMGDTTSGAVMRQLEQAPNVQLFDFTQADGYVRRITYINKLVFPQGSIDFGKNIPAHDVNLIGPTVELLARPTLHPALSDLLIETAQHVHKGPGLFKHRGEFPAPIEHDFPISKDATRYYTSGKSFIYKFLPFWLASLVGRILVSVVPLIVAIPILRLIPAFFRWKMQMRINRWYRELLALERALPADRTAARRDLALNQLAGIETEVHKMKVPASFADQFYGLREHIQFVRLRLTQIGLPPNPGPAKPA